MKNEKPSLPMERWTSLDTVSASAATFTGMRGEPCLTISRSTWDDLGNPMELTVTLSKPEDVKP